MNRKDNFGQVVTREGWRVHGLVVGRGDDRGGAAHLVRAVIAVLPAVAPPLHGDAEAVSTGELGRGAAGEGEHELVGKVGRALARVIVDRPLGVGMFKSAF